MPNKLISLEESTLNSAAKLVATAKNFKTVQELYAALREDLYDPIEFIYALDLLFILGRVTVDTESGVFSLA